jgi:PIN domain nuclease of toxin-antitoxin system
MEPFLYRLANLFVDQGGRVAALGTEICLHAATMEWAHRVPFDRILAATAIGHDIPLISADTVFDGLSDQDGWIARLW